MTSASSGAPFPTVLWNDDDATFFPGKTIESPTWVLVFPFYGDRLVLAQIAGRGWCIPSGRVEAGETTEGAAHRETHEESGATLGKLAPLGCFSLTSRTKGETRHGAAFLGDVLNLEDLPEGSESEGRILLPIEEVASAYFAWDALLAAVFAHAEESRLTLLPSGTSLSDFTRTVSSD